MKIFCKILACFFSLVCSGQNNVVNFDSIINMNVREFRERVGKSANIVITSEYFFDSKQYSESKKHEIITPGISSASITDESYCIKFLFINTERGLNLRVLYFKISKLRRKKYNLVNLGIGKEYFLDFVQESKKSD